MLYSLSVYGLLCLSLLIIIYKRHAILSHLPASIVDHLPERITRRDYALLNTFESQRAAGLSSAAFDIEANNIMAGDSRSGLDEASAAEIRAIMQSRRVTFDQARLIRHNQILARNGIDPSGMPLDTKAVTRL